MAQKESFLESKSCIRISDLQKAKVLGEKWPMLTSYDGISAKIFDQAKIPCLLIGDSASNVVMGNKSTLSITVDELMVFSKSVASNCKRALVIADLPFGSYRESPKQALRTAVRFMKEAGVHGVKMEGGEELSEHVKLLTSAGVPVMGHVGFTPQSVNTMSGFKIQGKSVQAVDKLVKDAKILEDNGAFACVVELVPADVGKKLSEALKIPVVGIGAGPFTDAQILVWTDMAGFNPPVDNDCRYLNEENGDANEISSLKVAKNPKFVKQYANMSQVLYQAAKDYANDVKLGSFPSTSHCYES